MQMTVKTQALAALTALCVIGVAAAAFVLFPRGPVYGPADLLPAEHTIAFFTDLDAAGAALLTSTIPLVNTLPVQDAPATYAIVRMPNGQNAWIAFQAARQGASPGVTSSDPAALTLLANGGQALAEHADFRSLMAVRAQDSLLWAYLRLPDAGMALPSNWQAPTGAVSVSMSTQDMRLAFITSERAGHTVNAGIRPFFVHPILTVQAGDFRTFLAAAAGHLAGERDVAFAGLAGAWFRSAFGPDLSLTYDLLPLLHNQTSLALGKTSASGGIIAVVEGTGGEDVEERINALHQGFSGAHAEAARMQRTFDETFTYDNVRIDEEGATITKENIAGWSITVNGTPAKTFATAINGRRFMLSNNAAALRSALGTYPPPQDGPAPTAQGTLDPPAARLLAESWLGNDHLLPPPFATQKSLLHWEVLRSGNVAVLRLF